VDALYIAGISITVFLFVIILGKSNKTPADKLLALWLFVMAFHLFLFYLYNSGNYLSLPWLLGLEIPVPLLHGPLIYLYVVALTNPTFKTNQSFWHFIPAFLALLAVCPFLIMSNEVKIAVYRAEGKGYEVLKGVVLIATMVSGVTYTLLSVVRLAKHQQKIEEQFSFTENINLRWLLYLVAGSAIIWVLVIFSNDTWIFSGIVLYIIAIGFFGIRQEGIFTKRPPEPIPGAAPVAEPTTQDHQIPELSIPTPSPKYQKTKIDEELAQSLHRQLSELMETEKLYTDPELTLADLAERLATHPNTLSQVINSIEQKNFYDYINLQRVAEFKRLVTLPSNQSFTLMSIAYDCGFNSKTSFNRNFKKHEGISPTEYVRLIRVQEGSAMPDSSVT
jgi:AraC-like DNA-binding protein